VKLICTWPVEVSAGVAKLCVPLFGHSIAWPPEAAASLTTVNGENRLWLERLSSSTTSEGPPLVLVEELELLLEEELELLLEVAPEEEELEELLLEEELELLELELVDEPLLLIEPVEAVRVTRSSLAPSSRLTIRSVCVPAARPVKVAGVIVP
jgi:hypothetical protein